MFDAKADGYIKSEAVNVVTLKRLEAAVAANDPTELQGVALAMCSRNRLPLVVGSIKANIGHSGPAAGISGLLKEVLAVEKGLIPGTPTFVQPSPSSKRRAPP